MPAFTESLAGKILLETSETGSLHVLLANQENFETPFSGLKGFIIPVGSDELEAGSIVFNFDDIPRGTYCIRCFLDTDGNGKLKRGVTGPAEPWGMSFRSERVWGIPKFSDVSFDVFKDIDDIIIIVR